MADCNHDCGSCGKDCGDRTAPGIQKAPMNKYSNVKKVIGVISGKGGVGKSSITSMLAVAEARRGKKVAIMDADITGPSIPKAFGVHEKAQGNDEALLPVLTDDGIKIMSINLLLEDETDPVVWRGPILGGVINQFWSDVVWGDVDVMFVDMPPGTGDVALTVYQSLPVDGIVIVTSPQQLVGMIVQKAVKMANMMNIPIVGIVENMAYFRCPDCGKEHKIFGDSHIEEIAAQYGIEAIAKLPLDPALAKACDEGAAEDYDCEGLDPILTALE
ncbi:MAG: Mrp/NBP35 family ATP-binding protein [Eubacterium sp.]|nr:Mrp/NBP35 family ATP-binding protein [Eubacterium sp.]